MNDAFSRFVKLLVLVAAVLECRGVAGLQRNIRICGGSEFPPLMLFSVVGMMLMASAISLMTLYMGVELMSLPIYVLAAFARDELAVVGRGAEIFRAGGAGVGAAAIRDSRWYGFSGSMSFAQLVTACWVIRQRWSPGLDRGRGETVVGGLAFKAGVGGAVPYVDTGCV